MRVYRIEDDEGRGVYCSMHARHLQGVIEHDKYRHPSPHGDSKWAAAYDARRELNPRFFMSQHSFGFESVASLRRWFYNDEWLALMPHPIRVSVYECPDEDVLVGRTQLTFTKSLAVLVGTTLPTELPE